MVDKNKITKTPVDTQMQSLASPADLSPAAAPQAQNPPQVYRDSKTGNISGVNIGGKDYLGLSPAEVNKIIAAENYKKALPPGSIEQGSGINPIEAQQQLQQPLPQANAIPQNTQQGTGIAKGGVFHSTFEALAGQQALGSDLTNYPVLLKKMHDNHLTPEQMSSDPFTQNLLRLDLNQLDLENIKKGNAKVSELGTLIESIPILGHIRAAHLSITAFVGITPSAKVKELLSAITDASSQSQKYVGYAQANPFRKQEYANLILANEKNVLELESRIKLISIQSPTIQGDPDQVNSIMEEITNAKQSIQDAKAQLGITR